MDIISSQVQELVDRYQTRDPYELCQLLGIAVRFKDLGVRLKAYYVVISCMDNIVISNSVSEQLCRVLVSHELGHAVLHHETAASDGFAELELFDATAPYEYEANLFAAELLLDDSDVVQCIDDPELTFFTMSGYLCVPPELLDYKFRMMRKRGFVLQAPIAAKAAFLSDVRDP